MNWTLPRLVVAVFSVIGSIVLLFIIPSLVESVAANQVVVIQKIDGELKCVVDPGPTWQGLGTVTSYPRRGTYDFSTHAKDADNGKQLQFNDGGKAKLYGSVNWEMPLDCKMIVAIHRTFGSAAGVEAQGVARMINSAIYLSGPAMSSTESSAERRGELVELINDQAQHGTYQTVTKQVERPDPVTGEKRLQTVVEVARDVNGRPKRQQGSILEQFGITLQPMSIERLSYSEEVEKQITARQASTQAVQLAQANARKAEQDAITTAKQGEATAAKAKWEQEAIKAKAVTEAEQKLAVASLAAKEAEQFKREQILRGEGEAERRKLVLAADGALDAKLEAYKHVMGLWAGAFKDFKGTMVPQVSMGGGAGANAVVGTQSLVDMLTAKTARDLALDLQNAAGAGAKK